MKQLLEFIPIIVFAVAYKLWGIYVATVVLMAATVAQMAILFAWEKKLSVMHQVTLALILVFGALTLGLRDERFIKWKFTLLHGVAALVLAVALWGMRKNLLKLLLNAQIELPEVAWHRLCVMWIAYFFLMAVLNAGVVLLFDTNTWINFKLGSIGLLFVFAVVQGVYIAKYWKNDSSNSSNL